MGFLEEDIEAISIFREDRDLRERAYTIARGMVLCPPVEYDKGIRIYPLSDTNPPLALMYSSREIQPSAMIASIALLEEIIPRRRLIIPEMVAGFDSGMSDVSIVMTYYGHLSPWRGFHPDVHLVFEKEMLFRGREGIYALNLDGRVLPDFYPRYQELHSQVMERLEEFFI